MQPTVDNSRYALPANHIPVISVGNYPMGRFGEGKCQENPYVQICFVQASCGLDGRQGSMQRSQTIMPLLVRNFLDTIEAFGYPVSLG